MGFWRVLPFLICFTVSPVSLASADDVIAGPVVADVVRVIDGDSFVVRAHVWPRHVVQENIRLAGVDVPELRGRCPWERGRARVAKAFVQRMIAGQRVRLYNLRRGKFRYLAELRTAAGDDMAELLIANGFARLYDGGKRQGWCAPQFGHLITLFQPR